MKLGLLPLIGIILGVLKVCGLITISWWWIALLVFIGPLFVLGVMAIMALMLGLGHRFK